MKEYYQKELELLRELGSQFAEAHPAVAPLLSSQGADPDVERILEGTAFLCGLIRQRLDDNFPEIALGLLDLTAPHLLRPVPSRTLVQFTAMPNVAGVQHVDKGVRLGSLPVDNQSCPYVVARPLSILPAVCTHASAEQITPGETRVRVTITGTAPLGSWLPNSLDFYLAAPLAQSCRWYKLLLRNLTRIEVQAGTRRMPLPLNSLVPLPHRAQFQVEGEELFSQFQIMQDYFVFPEGELFLSLSGLGPLASSNVQRIEISFFLSAGSESLPPLSPSLFALNVVPAVNAFSHTADPFVIQHTRQDYRLSPQGDSSRSMGIYAVHKVTGIVRGGEVRHYTPYTHFQKNTDGSGIYTLRRNQSPVSGRIEHYLGLALQHQEDIRENETLIADLTCYHHTLPMYLRVGDICTPTDSSPAMASFSNITPPTPPVPPIGDTNTLWQLFSCLHGNLLPLASERALREFLNLHIPANEADPSLERLQRHRVEAVRSFSVTSSERLRRGRAIRGLELSLTVDPAPFSSPAELFVFGACLEEALAHFSVINTYTALSIIDAGTGEHLSWPPRLGTRQLL